MENVPSGTSKTATNVFQTSFVKWILLCFGIGVGACSLGAADSNLLLAASNEKSGEVALIDASNRSVIGRVPLGARPRGIHASPDGKLLYVAVSTPLTETANGNSGIQIGIEIQIGDSPGSADGIAVIDVAQRKLVKKLEAGSDPEEFAISPDAQRLYVVSPTESAITIVNVESGAVEKRIRVDQGPEGIAINPANPAQLIVVCSSAGKVMLVNSTSGEIEKQMTVGGRPRDLALSNDGSRAFVPSESEGAVQVIDLRSFQIRQSIHLPPGSQPFACRISRNGAGIYVSTGVGGLVCVLDAFTETVAATIKVGERPQGVVLSPDGTHLFVANRASNDISIVDLATETEIGRIAAGDSPWGIETLPKQ